MERAIATIVAYLDALLSKEAVPSGADQAAIDEHCGTEWVRRMRNLIADFDNAIAACAKAEELLRAHYGDGKPKESTRPSWMGGGDSLAQVRPGLDAQGWVRASSC